MHKPQLMMGKWRQKAGAKKEMKSMFGEDILGSVGLKLSKTSDIVVGFGNRNPNSQKVRERRGKKKVKRKLR